MGDKLKSALEIAMEKYGLSKKGEHSLTEEQKEKIAEIRATYKAKKAELEIMFKQDLEKLNVAPSQDYFSAKEKLELQYKRDRQRVEREEESRIKAVREGDTKSDE